MMMTDGDDDDDGIDVVVGAHSKENQQRVSMASKLQLTVWQLF